MRFAHQTKAIALKTLRFCIIKQCPAAFLPALERLSRLLSSRFEQRRADSRGLPQRRGNQRLRPLVRGHGGSTVI